jgi:hypothetical protein
VANQSAILLAALCARRAGSNILPKAELLAYFHEVREISRKRLEATTEADFDKMIHDAHYGLLSGRDVWGGVVTSFAWHAGQIALTNRLMSDVSA